jgi:hypothetical protein
LLHVNTHKPLLSDTASSDWTRSRKYSLHLRQITLVSIAVRKASVAWRFACFRIERYRLK